jgi:hypothetical protein
MYALSIWPSFVRGFTAPAAIRRQPSGAMLQLQAGTVLAVVLQPFLRERVTVSQKTFHTEIPG